MRPQGPGQASTWAPALGPTGRARPPDPYGHRRARSPWTPWALLVVCVALTFGAWGESLRARDASAHAADGRTVRDLDQTTARVLRSVRGLTARAERDLHWVGAANPDRLQAFVATNELTAHETGVVALTFVQATPTPEGYSVTYAEPRIAATTTLPADVVKPALDAAARADDTGEPALSSVLALPITHSTDGSSPPSVFAVVVPAYSSGTTPATVAQRREHLVGWIVSLVDSQFFAREVLARSPRVGRIEIFDGATTARSAEVVTFAPPSAGATSLGPARTSTVRELGHTWTLRSRAEPAHESPQIAAARRLLLIAALILSLLVFVIAELVRRSERRAYRMVDEATRKLSQQAYQDALTGLPNRAAFIEQLEAALTQAADTDLRVAVLFSDLDHFKFINDTLGHEAGDQLLIDVARRLRHCVRPTDLVARLGGDEFTVLLQSVRSPADAHQLAERIGAALRQPVAVGGRELVVTTSTGIALADSSTKSASDVLRHADLAMYLAKERGRGRWEDYDPASTPRVAERLKIETELWRAIDRGELVVYYQPEVSLRTGNVVGLEALVRWQHPERGLLPPAAFVPLAEETSLIVAIDRYVLHTACHQAGQWRREGEDILISVNLSPRFLREIDAVQDIPTVLAAAGLPAASLQLEITERTAIADDDPTTDTLQRLRRLGVRVAIDDFGTGYSSFEYLRRFPVDILKLDRTFIDALDTRAADAVIVQAVITMGHALGLTVTAEGVERSEQAAVLRSLGCDTAQGFHFARALPGDEIEALLRAGERLTDRTIVPFPTRGTA